MNWEEILNNYGALIEEQLRTFFTETVKEAETYHQFVSKVYTDIEKFVLRKGKRLASCSTLLTYKGYTGVVD